MKSPQNPPAERTRMGDFGALTRVTRSLQMPEEPPAEAGAVSGAVLRKRQMVAGFCRMIFEQLGETVRSLPQSDRPLSPREYQTLERLLAGDAEKQIAARLKLSQHTVHVYVKSLYKRFAVSSRAELLARWVRK